MKITSLDVETANNTDPSICAVGLAMFEDGRLAETRHWLIQPPRGFGDFTERNIECHGITPRDVHDAPQFSGIANEVCERLLAADTVIAHNAAFDMRKLRGTLDHFKLARPGFGYLCTCKLSRRMWPGLPNHQLPTVAAHIGHRFQHHQAMADAEAAGRIFLAMAKTAKAKTPAQLADATRVDITHF